MIVPILLYQGLALAEKSLVGGCLCMLLSAGTFGLVALASFLYRAKVEAGYDLYTQACIYAALVFEAFGLDHKRPLWVNLRHDDPCFGGAAAFPHLRVYPHNWLDGPERYLHYKGTFDGIRQAGVGHRGRFPWSAPRAINNVVFKHSREGEGRTANDAEELGAVWKAAGPNLWRAYTWTRRVATGVAVVMLAGLVWLTTLVWTGEVVLYPPQATAGEGVPQSRTCGSPRTAVQSDVGASVR
ncbi:MAG TPA: hypothetical protein VHN77_02920 [Phycisphaerales bacterium]|nr:hypothetical protein [Phycisphaerales bacterium]